jgi:hypothetical protein
MTNASDAAYELVETIKKPFRVAKEWLNKIPDQKQEYNDYFPKQVEKANESFRKASEKKKVASGTKQNTVKTIKKSASRKKVAAKR